MWWSRVLEVAQRVLWVGEGSNLSAACMSAIAHVEGQDMGFPKL